MVDGMENRTLATVLVRRRESLLVGICLIVAGCMPSTLNELKQDGAHHAFIVDAQYQELYRDTFRLLERCVGGGFLNASVDVDANLYPDLRLGEVTVSNNNMGDKSVMLSVEMTGLGDATEVDVYHADVGMWRGYPGRLQAVLQDRRNDCP